MGKDENVIQLGKDGFERGSYSVCLQKLKNIGLSELEAKMICGPLFYTKDTFGDDEEETLGEKNTKFNLLFVDSDECVSAKIKIFAKEHPKWGQDRWVAAAKSWCKKNKNIIDAKQNVSISEPVGRSKAISLARFATLIRLIKSKKGLKVGHMGILPFKTELPMKNLNRLQTKMEKMTTEEQKFLTMEELTRRAQYATLMKKADSDSEEDSLSLLLNDFIESFIVENPQLEKKDVVTSILEEIKDAEKCNYFINSEVEIGKFNDGLNNIIKFPIILAKEMVQMYTDTDELGNKKEIWHFKPYEELKKAAENAPQKIPITIEHLESVTPFNTVGYVKNIRADDSTRTIKGMGYAYQSKLPKLVLDAIKKGEIVPVSIEFFAQLGDSGTFNNQKYDVTQENIGLTALAICIDSIARCPPDSCGINHDLQITEDSKKITIIKKENHFINICKLLTNPNEIEKNSNIKEENTKMQKDSFPDPKSGKTAGDEPDDLEAMLSGLRKFMAGITDPDEKAKLRRRIFKAFKDVKENMDEKEYKDAIAKKDEEISLLKKDLEVADKFRKDIIEEKRQDSIKTVLKFVSDKFKDSDLQKKEYGELKIIAETVSLFNPSNEQPPVIPIAGKDADLKDGKGSARVDPSQIFAKTNEKFDISGL